MGERNPAIVTSVLPQTAAGIRMIFTKTKKTQDD